MIIDFKSTYDSDVILLATAQDGSNVELHTHKTILSDASPFFHAMFSLPQPPPLEETTSAIVKPVIPVPEPAHVIQRVLEYIYHMPTKQSVSDLDELTALLLVATKYDLTPAVESLRTLLVSPELLSSYPLQVYTTACRFDLDQEAALASKWTLNIDLLGVDEDLDDQCLVDISYLRHLSAYDYHRLLVFRRRRIQAVDTLLQFPDDIKCMHCSGSVFTMRSPPKWWQQWADSAKRDLRKRPLDTDKIFGLDNIFGAAAKTGCAGCVESVVSSWTALMSLKEKVDRLPSTI